MNKDSDKNQFCDFENRLRRPCSNILDKCFTAEHVHYCTTYCYDIRRRSRRSRRPKIPVAGCRIPTPPAKGRFDNTSDHVPYNTTIKASCDHGYRLCGSRLLRCGDNGTWIGTSPLCSEIACTSPPQVFHGQWEPSFPDTNVVPGTTTTAHCESGYSLHGDPVVTCHSNGSWQSAGQYPGCLPDNMENMAGSISLLGLALTLIIVISVIGFVMGMRFRRRRQNLMASTPDAPQKNNQVGKTSTTAGTLKRFVKKGNSKCVLAPFKTSLSSQPVLYVNVKVNVNNSNSDQNSKAPTINSGISTGDSENAPRPDGLHTNHGRIQLDSFPIQETAVNHDQENELHGLIAPSLSADPVVYLRNPC